LTDQITTEAKLAKAEQNSILRGIPPHKCGGPEGMMFSTWRGCKIRVEYRDASGRAQTMSGKLLDTFPVGIVVGERWLKSSLHKSIPQ
jgi:hypothetical protein